MKIDLYENYTSTSVLTGVDEEKLTAWSVRYFRRHFSPHVPTNKQAKILEIGCGYGRYVKGLQDEGYTQVQGVDISEEQIKYAQEQLGLDSVQRADALTYLEERNEKYDCVLIIDVLEHLEVDYSIALLRKVREALNPGGKVIIQVPNGLSPLSPNFHNDITHKRAYSYKSIGQTFLLSGFKKFASYEAGPFIYSFKSAIHYVVWNFFLKPIVTLSIIGIHGSREVRIFTNNIIGVATKE